MQTSKLLLSLLILLHLTACGGGGTDTNNTDSTSVIPSANQNTQVNYSDGGGGLGGVQIEQDANAFEPDSAKAAPLHHQNTNPANEPSSISVDEANQVSDIAPF